MRLGRPMRRARAIARRRARDLGQEGGGVDFAAVADCRQRREARQQRAQRRGGGEIGLADSEPVGERDLPARLAMPVECIEAVDGIDQRRDIGEPQSAASVASANKACRIGPGSARPEVSTTMRRNDNSPASRRDSSRLQALDEIAAQRATQAARGEQRDLPVEPLVKAMVERRFAELVDDDERVAERGIAEQAVEETRLAGAEETCDEMNGNHGPTGTSLPKNTGEPPLGSTVTAYMALRMTPSDFGACFGAMIHNS